MQSLILFASGAGSNARAIINYFRDNGKARVSLIVSGKANAGVLDIAREAGIPSVVINRQTVQAASFLEQLKEHSPALIVLAGFMWKMPEHIVQAFHGKIVNIHPALLPAHGGKGMYGSHVHEAVLAAGEQESGITIHFVNEQYDEGNIIVQARCPVLAADTAGTLAARVHRLEHHYYPRAIEFLLANENFY